MSFRARAAALVGGLFFATTSLAAVHQVTKTADTDDGICDADCSLREAIDEAVNSLTDDIITFAPSFYLAPTTITLGGSEIVISGPSTLEIEGPGESLLTIDGDNASRIFVVEADTKVSIRGMTLTRGNGAGAANSGRAGAFYNNGGVVLLENIVFDRNTANNAGALCTANEGDTTVWNTLFIENTALTSSGGAIQNFSGATLKVYNSTFFRNTSNSTTGGGGAQLNGTAVIANSTFSENHAQGGDGGGISSNGPYLLLVNSTFAYNRADDEAGGLHRRTTNPGGYLRNNIFANNQDVAGTPDVDANADITSLGNNIVGSATGTLSWLGSDLLDVDPLLMPLAFNGGDTPSHGLDSASPAIDAGQACVLVANCASDNLGLMLTFDQRGTSRPTGSGVDIGAHEWTDPVLFSDGFE
ncbi:MAG: CSLREA domain-containing protein [Lysobacteraceae bacterium]